MKNGWKDLKKGFIFGALFLLLLALPVKVSAYSYSSTDTIQAKGKTFYLQKTYSSDKNLVKLYQKTASGRKLVASKGSAYWTMSYSASYGNKLYFTYQFNNSVNTYSYTIGKKGFKLVKKNLQIADAKGRYAIGYTSRATDVGSSKLCLYDLKTKKLKSLGRGYDPKRIENKYYYAKMSKDYKTMWIMRCNLNGTGEKVLKKVKTKHFMFGTRVYKNYATYTCQIKSKRGYSYKEYKVRY